VRNATRRLFRLIVATVAATSSGYVAGTGCGGSSAEPCHATSVPDASALPCSYWKLTLAGDPAACGFDDAGYPVGAACQNVCGSTAVSYCTLSKGNVTCNTECGSDS
jgi:hypothetical protein